jgi:hypothetical protein
VFNHPTCSLKSAHYLFHRFHASSLSTSVSQCGSNPSHYERSATSGPTAGARNDNRCHSTTTARWCRRRPHGCLLASSTRSTSQCGSDRCHRHRACWCSCVGYLWPSSTCIVTCSCRCAIEEQTRQVLFKRNGQRTTLCHCVDIGVQKRQPFVMSQKLDTEVMAQKGRGWRRRQGCFGRMELT